jgi:hypothetical protein
MAASPVLASLVWRYAGGLQLHALSVNVSHVYVRLRVLGHLILGSVQTG